MGARDLITVQRFRPPRYRVSSRRHIETSEYSLMQSSSPIALFPDSLHERISTEVENVWCAPLDVAGIEFKTVLLNTGAAALLVVADDFDADMIVVGRRGKAVPRTCSSAARSPSRAPRTAASRDRSIQLRRNCPVRLTDTLALARTASRDRSRWL
jgi:hypothetical protein